MAGYSPLRQTSPSLSMSTDEETQTVRKPVVATWKGRLWDTFDLPREERRLMFKVDAVILTFASLGYFIK